MIAQLQQRADELGLEVAGLLHPDPESTLVLLMASPGFWDILKAAPEFGRPDPVDRYSSRVVGMMAQEVGAVAEFPFGGPPYTPFIAWAIASGRAWQSPVGMLVHETAGLMISYRGALRFDRILPGIPDEPVSPCRSCAGQPCLGACPVDALSAQKGYDVEACHGFLDTPAGQDCMTRGCKARRACPVSQSFGRDPEQSAHHMAAFHSR